MSRLTPADEVEVPTEARPPHITRATLIRMTISKLDELRGELAQLRADLERELAAEHDRPLAILTELLAGADDHRRWCIPREIESRARKLLTPVRLPGAP